MKFKVQMHYTRAYYVEVEAKNEEHAKTIARFHLTPEDCEADEYSEWEVYSVYPKNKTWNVYTAEGEFLTETYSKDQVAFEVLFYKQQTGKTATFKKAS